MSVTHSVQYFDMIKKKIDLVLLQNTKDDILKTIDNQTVWLGYQ